MWIATALKLFSELSCTYEHCSAVFSSVLKTLLLRLAIFLKWRRLG